MKKYFEQLRPMERRLVVGVCVIFLVVLNALFVWPHFSDWGRLQGRLAKARGELARNQEASAQIPALKAQVETFASQGDSVALEDQAIDLMRTIQAQASAAGFGIRNYNRSLMRTNDQFFVEQVQVITVVAPEEQLVDFFYKLGSGASMIRVRDLELSPDPPHQRLSANIKLVASYQKKPKQVSPASPAAPAPAAKPSNAKVK